MLKLGELVTFLKGDDRHFRDSLEKAKKRLDDFGSSAAGKAAKIGAAMGLSLGAAFIANLALDQSTQAGIVAARLGVSDPAHIARYGSMAGKLYADNFLASMDDVTKALSLVARSDALTMSGTEEEIQRVSSALLTLTTVFEQDATRVAAAAESMIRTGMARDAIEAFDLLTRGIQTGADKAEDLADTFVEYSTMFRDLGLNGAEALGLINQALAAGARNSDVAADALKEFAIRGQDASVASAEGFKILGLNAEEMTRKVATGGSEAREALGLVLQRLHEMEDPVARNAAAVALFGTKAEDLADALFAMDLETATESMTGFAGATERAGEIVGETAGANLEKFKRGVQQAVIEQLGKAVGWLETAGKFYREHEEILGPLAGTLLTVAGAIGAVVIAVKVWTAVQWALNIALGANPIGLIILSITALIAIIWLLAANWSEIWGGIKDAALAVGRWFRDTLWEDWIKGAWDGILDKGKDVWHWLTVTAPQAIRDAFGAVTAWLANPFIKAFNWINEKWNAIAGKINDLPAPLRLGMTLPILPIAPELAEGGVVPATPGGRLVRVGEGRHDEIVAPEPMLADLTYRAMVRAMGELGDMGASEVTVHVYLDGEPVRSIARAEVVRQSQRSADWARAARASRRR